MSYENLIEKFQDFRVKNIDPHEVSQEMNRLYQMNDVEGLKKLREAYVDGISKSEPDRDLDDIDSVAEKNFLGAAMVADLVNLDGQEASGQLSYVAETMGTPKEVSGSVTNFYRNVFK